MPIEIKNRYTGKIIYTHSRDSLKGAILTDADMTGADLTNATLTNADLANAILRNADLTEADLRNADLTGAILTGAIIPTGETWEVYQKEVVPALLKAGGNAVTPESWQCHTWDNCLIACAFGVHSIDQVPVLYQPRAKQLIQFFDARLLKPENCGFCRTEE